MKLAQAILTHPEGQTQHLNPRFNTIIEALSHWNNKKTQKIYCRLNTISGEETLTYHDLYLEALNYCGKLRHSGIEKGDRVLLAVPNGRTFLSGFLGILMSGGVAVPVVTRDSVFIGLNKAHEIIGHILEDCQARFIITTPQNEKLWKSLAAQLKLGPINIIYDKDKSENNIAGLPVELFPDDYAFIQYTSGSTNLPKGVVIQHKQLIYQVESIVVGLNSSEKDIAVSWLPLFHDMGLIGTFLHSLYVGMEIVLMSPEKFLFDPKQWLLAISKYKATMSTGPNSAYSICVSRIKPEEIEGLNLSSWRVAFSGAEPVSIEIMNQFIEMFEPYGFNGRAICPGYGMAENCLAISFCVPGEGLKWDSVQRDALESKKKAIQGGTCDEKTVCFVSVGRPILDHTVHIIDEKGHVLPERSVGEICVKGPCIMAGYFHKYEETAEALKDDWLYTGDLGYVAEGDLYITGRKKDLIIRGGRNYIPQDLERSAEKVEGVRHGCVIAVGLFDEKTGTEKIAVLAEVKPQFYKKEADIKKKISRAIFEEIGIAPDEVFIYRRGTLLRTTSGKLQRAKYKKLLEEGSLDNSFSLLDRIRYFKFKVHVLWSVLLARLKARH